MSNPKGTEAETRVVVTRVIAGPLLEQLWDLYLVGFEANAGEALARQSLDRDSFDRFMDDRGTYKIVALHDGEPVGLFVLTSSLELVTDIDVAFVRREFSRLWAKHAVFYAVFAFVATSARAVHLYYELTRTAGQIAAAKGGVILGDMSEAQRDRGNARLIRRAVRSFPNGSMREIDAQIFYVVELPEPIAPFDSSNPFQDVVMDLVAGEVVITPMANDAAPEGSYRP